MNPRRLPAIPALIPALVALGAFLSGAAPAQACPFCHTDTAAAVRAGIFNATFTANLFYAALPFAVLALIIMLQRRLS